MGVETVKCLIHRLRQQLYKTHLRLLLLNAFLSYFGHLFWNHGRLILYTCTQVVMSKTDLMNAQVNCKNTFNHTIRQHPPLSAITAACLGFFIVGLTKVGRRVGVRLLATFLIQSNLNACSVVTELPLSCV